MKQAYKVKFATFNSYDNNGSKRQALWAFDCTHVKASIDQVVLNRGFISIPPTLKCADATIIEKQKKCHL